MKLTLFGWEIEVGRRKKLTELGLLLDTSWHSGRNERVTITPGPRSKTVAACVLCGSEELVCGCHSDEGIRTIGVVFRPRNDTSPTWEFPI